MPSSLCPCAYPILSETHRQTRVDRVLYNNVFLRFWLRKSLEQVETYHDKDHYTMVFYSLVDRAARVWHKLFLYSAWVFSKTDYFRMIFPRFGVWVMMRHDDGVCMAGRPLPSYSLITINSLVTINSQECEHNIIY
jgi:hypothetical protein